MAFADLNGDNGRDLLWVNVDTGAIQASLMNGLTMLAGGPVQLAGAHVVAADDFDGDGKDDLVTERFDGNATLYETWLMDGLDVKSSAGLLYSDWWGRIP